MRRTLMLLAGAAILAAANWTVFQREQVLAQGQVVILELAPIDPRSLMQGDYMALRFRVANEAFGRRDAPRNADGRVVVKVEADGVARFARLDGGEPLGAGEVPLRYRVREGVPKFATNAFFFQEGQGARYQGARYGEFRVDASGEMLLTHLLGEKRQRLGGLGG